MCIRDRRTAARDDAGRDVLGRSPEQRIEGTARLGDLVGTCLLYTSDAADDLLCVDLGGRRIIKKKNPNQHIITSNHIRYKPPRTPPP